MRILVAEDDNFSQLLLKRTLEKRDYQVVTADHGRMAWDIFQKEDFSLIITDWMMPEMDGLELCQKIRESESSRYVYIIIVTSMEDKKDLVRAMDAGADDYITKPYDRGELIARVRAGQRIIALEQEISDKNRELLNANIVLKNDLIAARRLQDSFLPKKAPQVAGFEFSGISHPCEMLGGDTFNFFQIDKDHVAVYVADVSGHGVPAAMLSVMLSRILTPDPDRGGLLTRKSQSAELKPLTPAEVADVLNRRFPMDTEVGQYFTLLYGLVHLPTLRMSVIQAGHPYLLHIQNKGELQLLKKPGFPIGIYDQADFQEEYIQLSVEDKVIFYSDGIVEAENDEGQSFGDNRLTASITSRANKGISEITDGILKDVLNFSQGREAADDMTLVGFSINSVHP